MLLKQWIVTVGRLTPGKFSKGRSQEKTQLQRLDFSAAWVVRSNLNDPRRISYLLVWKDEIHGGGIKEAVRLAGYVEPSNSRVTDDYVDLKRTDGSATVLRILANAPLERRARTLPALSVLRDAAPSRLWLGMGQHKKWRPQSGFAFNLSE